MTKKFLLKTLVFLLIFTWLFSGWPRIWPLDELGTSKIRIPPEVQEIDLSTKLLLTAILAFVTLIIVNPPRAYFGRCGVLFCGKIIL